MRPCFALFPEPMRAAAGDLMAVEDQNGFTLVKPEEVSDCDYCNGSREGQRWDSDLKQMVTVPNGCKHCCGEEAV